MRFEGYLLQPTEIENDRIRKIHVTKLSEGRTLSIFVLKKAKQTKPMKIMINQRRGNPPFFAVKAKNNKTRLASIFQIPRMSSYKS